MTKSTFWEDRRYKRMIKKSNRKYNYRLIFAIIVIICAIIFGPTIAGNIPVFQSLGSDTGINQLTSGVSANYEITGRWTVLNGVYPYIEINGDGSFTANSLNTNFRLSSLLDGTWKYIGERDKEYWYQLDVIDRKHDNKIVSMNFFIDKDTHVGFFENSEKRIFEKE